MIELGQLNARHDDFRQRKVRIVAVSLETLEEARQTQGDFPQLFIASDQTRDLSEKLDLIHEDTNPNGGDTSAPTAVKAR